jgi:hypothetical protein
MRSFLYDELRYFSVNKTGLDNDMAGLDTYVKVKDT